MFKKSFMGVAIPLVVWVVFCGNFGSASAAPAAASTATPTPVAVPAAGNGNEEYRDFLSENYAIDFGEAKTVTQKQFNDALDTVFGEQGTEALSPDIDMDGFSALEAVLSTVYIANIDELADTYNDQKTQKALEYWINIPQSLPVERKHELAVAIDHGLLSESWNGIDFEENVTSELATDLFGNLLENTGKYKHFAGYISDPAISGRILYIWNSFDQVSAPEIQTAADEMVKDGLITGYNIKRVANRPLFDRDRSLVYGHSSIAHAIQLIDLMKSEGLDGKVMLEPKTSAYLYLKDWGEPQESPEFQVEPLPDGNYIAYAKEYDLSFEFMSTSDKVDFDELILKYAKKSEDKQEDLIIDSWWQPLYSSETPIDSEGYQQIVNNRVAKDGFFIQSFSQTEDSTNILAAFKSLYPEGDASVIDLWVDQAFYRYLQGESE